MATTGKTKYSYTDLRKLWLKAGGSRAWSYVMAAIAMAESSGVIYATHHDSDGSVDYGLWQINSVHGYNANQLTTNALYNAKAAVAVFNGSGPGAWSTYKNGSYKKYMPGNQQSPADHADWHIFKGPHSVDQGVDWPGKGVIPALDVAKVTDVGTVNIIEGGRWPEVIYQLLAGPHKGQYVYTMENFDPVVKKGQKVQRGEPIGVAKGQSPYIEVGFNKQPTGINPVSPLYPNPHSPKPSGFAMQTYIQQDVSQGGGVSVGGVVGDIGSGIGDAASGIYSASGAQSAVNAATGLFDFLGHPLSGIESLILQGFFILIGLLLVIGGLALMGYTLAQKTGVLNLVGGPGGAIGKVQSQQRIRQSGARIEESRRAATAREELRAQSLAESQRASQVRESQATRRLSEQRQKRKLSEKRLNVREAGVARRNPPDRKFMDVKRDDRTAAKKKPGKKVSGPPRKT